MKSSAVPAAEIEVADNPQGSGSVWRLTGAWGAQTAVGAQRKLDSLVKGNSNVPLEIDLSAVERMDTAGAWLLRQAIGEREEAGGEVKLTDPQGRFSDLIKALPGKLREPAGPKAGKPSLFVRFFTPIGRNVVEVWDDMVAAMYILGSAVRGAQLKLGRRSGVSPAAIVNQIDQMGVKAVPIIMLMSFLIGAIIAQQGAFQLRYFGAEVFVVDLVGILQLREIGVLLTAIMIAGRSGSAITAEIGSMKMREEIDALKVMGLSPVGVLVFPRLVALTVALPLLTIIANFAALAGAAVVANAYSGITYDTFLSRLREAIDISTIVSGMIKAPFMALVIGIVASVEGLKVGGSAESLGLHVTTSVVKSIFVVILMDGLFAMFYAAIDF
ncbi:ABC transporter permease [Mycoplana rhizolycopersici]|uniref:MlaE family lipid ABC transporter permease subunit n=1 Tax=Mycoplana rhizolycopersici TaxID=2746702 RepID=A0ABX2QKI2_9HYPH|nr:MlaE family lipid ABC transporter permease subunit [Rhizobium rhizolycopersici]NVP57078.1 MlaE family lipid ABC transporter permease subunit [Rhizobium rhizolycopersici]